MGVVSLGISTICHRATGTLLAWNFGAASVLLDSVGSETLVLTGASIVLGSVLEGVIRALHTTLHSCLVRSLALAVLGGTAVGRSSSRGDSLGAFTRCGFGLVNGYTLSVLLVLGSVTANVPRRVDHLLKVVVIVDAS